MEIISDHNKIIKKAAKEVLLPHGLFQKGSSRVWIDDNKWFLTIVEFQPSNWEKGSYLNIGICFLWNITDYLHFDYYLDSSRQDGFVSYSDNCEEFYDKMIHLSKSALQKVNTYREYKNVEYARDKIIERKGYSSSEHELYNKMMVFGYAKDNKAQYYFNELSVLLQNAAIPWQIEMQNELTNLIQPIINDKQSFYNYIQFKIDKQRRFWSEKSSMKKLNK